MTRNSRAIISGGCLRRRQSDLARFHRLKEGQRRRKTLSTKSGPLNWRKAAKGSFYNQEKLLDERDNDRDHEASDQAEMSASRAKILLQETVEAEEIDEEKWTKLKGRSIVQN